MPRVKMDARLAELAFLDVLDARPDGMLRLNATFVAECLAACGDQQPPLEDLLRDQITQRASQRRHAPSMAPARLARAALQIEKVASPSRS